MVSAAGAVNGANDGAPGEALPGRRVAFAARSMGGAIREQSGLLHLPEGAAPEGGYPVVVYGHMTTGACEFAAPSLAAPGHVEWRRISQGDALCRRLLRRGIAVLRPDYEGMSAGSAETGEVHPYLIGASLGESMLAMARARRALDARLGDRLVFAGHSEGSVAALYASVAAAGGANGNGAAGPGPAGAALDADARLLGTAAFTPVTRMDRSIGAARRLGARFPGVPVVSALIGLMLRGAAVEDRSLRELVAGEGLSAEARAVWRHLDERSLVELARPDSWGGIAPNRIGGARGEELWRRLFESFRRNEIAALRPGDAQPPLRIDAALFDEVAPAPLTRALLRGYREAGFDLTARWWPTHHSGAMRDRYAPSEAADWIARRLEA